MKYLKRRQHKYYTAITRLMGPIFLLLAGLTTYGQQDTALPVMDSSPVFVDTIKHDFIKTLKKIGADEAARSISKFEEDRITTKQDELIEAIKQTTQDARDYLKIGMDTIGLSRELTKTDYWFSIVGDGVFTNPGTAHTYRNLTTSSNILKELLSRILKRKAALDNYSRTLTSFRNKIDSLNSDTVLYRLASDSTIAMHYLQKLLLLSKEIKPADSIFKKALANVEVLQVNVNQVVAKLGSSLEQLEVFQQEIADQTFSREFANLGDNVGFKRPFSEIISFSAIKGRLALFFYATNNAGLIVLLVLLIIASALFLRNLKQNLRSQQLLNNDYSGQLVLRYPVLSAILIVLNIFQFIFYNPPFIFNALLWIISAIALTIIFRNFITKYWMRVWLTMFLMFLLATADNLVLQASRTERWIMLGMAAAGAITGSAIVIKGRREELREKWIIYFIGFVALMEMSAAITNIYGRYNLSKTILNSGFFSVIIAILFLWTVRLINEGLSLASRVYQRPDKKLFYINFERVGNKVPAVFYIFLIVGWFILVGRNFYSFRLLAEPIMDFISRKRMVGDFTFTVESMLVFFLILILSAFTSKLVSFFATDKNTIHDTPGLRGGVGSWLLLIRISIISIGVFFAFAAAGIPMDRFTIIVGALSVGIGFGLQTLVNNLVSGLIISFEKPVSVGDIVEIGGRAGTIKSIGFRSSVIATWDGADVVIPNGDLMNQHLVNWTMDKNTRRIDIIVGVAYGTDLQKTKQLLREMLAKDERILPVPAPAVIAKEFNNSSIDMQLLFWVRNIREWVAVKSDTITAIDTLFKKHGIVIPFPQQDLHIYPAPAKKENNETGA